jgi:5-methyltetrahydrofolate--homocysteine methyltransferase
MTTATILDLISERTVLLDGGLGTELMKRGLPQGTCPELWNVKNPDAVKDVYRSYFEAGSDAVVTNSFGGSRIKLAAYGLADQCHELNFAAAQLAQEVKPKGRFVGGSLGPTGKFLQPQGEFTEADFEQAFALQAKALIMGKVDFLLIETMFDLREALSALKGARQAAASMPVFVTMTFDRKPRGFFTLMGDSVAKCIEALEENKVPVIGTNCTLTSGDMADLIQEMRSRTSLPLIAQPNAGQPGLSDSHELVYSQGIQEYIRHVRRLIENGANLIGGCCGTTPEYIWRMADIVKTIKK